MAFAFLVLLIPWPLAPPSGADHLKAAIDAARRREGLLRSFTISWKVKTHVPKGGRMDADPVGLPLPRRDEHWESSHSLVMDGDRFRLLNDSPGRHPDLPDGEVVYDGTRLTTRRYVSGRDKPAHVIAEAPGGHVELGFEPLAPIALWCRGARQWANPGPRASVEVRELVERIDGARCREFRVRRSSGTAVSYWLDVDRGYLVRRIDRRDDVTVEVVDIAYVAHATLAWVPRRWTQTRTRRDGKVGKTVRAEVTEVHTNQPVPADTFDLKPSPGDFVADHLTRKSFHVRSDGSLEEIDPAGGAVVPASGEPRQPPVWPARTVVRVLVIGGLAGVVLAALILRRRGRAPHTPTS
jgi:hypothetical protein